MTRCQPFRPSVRVEVVSAQSTWARVVECCAAARGRWSSSSSRGRSLHLQVTRKTLPRRASPRSTMFRVTLLPPLPLRCRRRALSRPLTAAQARGLQTWSQQQRRRSHQTQCRPDRPRWLLTFGVGLGLAGRLSVGTDYYYGYGGTGEYADGVGQYVFGLDCYGPNGYFAFSLNLVERTAHRSYNDGSPVNTYESGKALTFSLSSGLSVLRFPLWIFPAQLYVGLGLFQMSNDDRLEDSSLLPITGIEGRLNVRAIGPLYVTGALQFGNRLGAPDSGWAFAATLDVGIRVTADSSVDPVAPDTLPAGHAVAAGAR